MKNFNITPVSVKNPLGTKTIGTATNVDLTLRFIVGDANAEGEYKLYDDAKMLLDSDTVVVPIGSWPLVEQNLYNSFASVLGVTITIS